MQLTTLTVLLATASGILATPLAARDLPAGVTFVAANNATPAAGADNGNVKRGYVSDACIATCWSGYSSGMVSFYVFSFFFLLLAGWLFFSEGHGQG